MREVGLAAEAVETVEDVVGRVERGIAVVTDTEVMPDRSRVRTAAGVTGTAEPVVIQARLDRPAARPHGGRRVLLPALALAGGRG